MGASNTEQSKINFFALKAKTSESDPTPFFGKNVKKDGNWIIEEKFNSMNGHLVDIEHSSYEYEGETKHKCKLTFQDKDGTKNIVESNFNNLLYSALNSLVSCDPDFVEMNVWLGKAKVIDGKIGKQYPGIAVKNNGRETKWNFEYDSLPKGEKVKAGNKTVVDDSKVIEFWIKVIDNIKPKLKKLEVTESTMQPNEEFSTQNPDPDSGLPF